MGDLRLVDRLARLKLRARRRGVHFALVEPPERVRELIELCGLTEVLVEPRRQPEEREERGSVEEERELRDPPFS
jgi:anti-anti-sigma regulatory factor